MHNIVPFLVARVIFFSVDTFFPIFYFQNKRKDIASNPLTLFQEIYNVTDNKGNDTAWMENTY